MLKRIKKETLVKLFWLLLVVAAAVYLFREIRPDSAVYEGYDNASGIAVNDMAADGGSARMEQFYGNVAYETTRYTDAEDDLMELVDQYGGKLDSKSVSYQYRDASNIQYADGYYHVRIPTKDLLSFLSDLQDAKNLHMVSQSVSMDDVAESYLKHSDEKSSIEDAIGRLEDLMDQTSDVSEIVEIESQIRSLRSELSYVEDVLTDEDTSYAELSVSIQEVSVLSVRSDSAGYTARFRDALLVGWNSGLRILSGIGLFVASNWLILMLVFLSVYTGHRLRKRMSERRETCIETSDKSE